MNVSLRDYIFTTSQGRADLQGAVQDVYTLSVKDVPPAFLASEFEDRFKSDGFDAAALVMLGNPPDGQAEGIFKYWARFGMRDYVGVWAMELTHLFTGIWDLYTNDPVNDLRSFDNMDLAYGTHPTAYTKVELGWLDPSAIVLNDEAAASFELHSIGLVQPPPPGRVTAVQIATSGNPLFVEARLRVDQYDGGKGCDPWSTPGCDPWNSPGINSEGVIVYELAGVQNPNPPPGLIDPLIRLRTRTALTPGQTFTSEADVRVTVAAELTGGFRVDIVNPTAPTVVPDVFGFNPQFAATEIQQAGLVPHFVPASGGKWVKSQNPIAGTKVSRGTTVTMMVATSGFPP